MKDQRITRHIMGAVRSYKSAKTMEEKLDIIMFLSTIGAASLVEDEKMKNAVVRFIEANMGGK